MSDKLPFGITYQEIPLLNNKGDIITYDDSTETTFILPLGVNGNILTANNALDHGVEWTTPAGGVSLVNKGDLLSHDGTTENILPVNVNNEYILRVDPTATDGINWDSVNNILPSKSKGDLISNNGIASAALTVGTNGQVLIADSGETTGLKWDDVKNNTVLTTKGDILTHDATSAVRLGVGSDDQILIADSSDPNGVIWADNVSVPITTKGDVLSNDGSMNVRLGVGTNGQVLSADSSETSGLKWITSSSSSVLTTKGDLLGRDNTTEIRIPVGSNGQILVADSADTNGVGWEDVKDNTVLTTKGDVMGHNGTNALRIAVGTDNQLLISDSTVSEGLSWKDISEVIGASGITWREPVIVKQTTPPGGPSAGDRYIVLPTGTGAWTGQDNDIAVWNGATWDFTVPAEGWALWVEDSDEICVFNGTAWVKLGFTIDHFNLMNIGLNTHVQIDSHISDTSNPHSVTLNQVTVATTKGDLLAYTGATSTRLPVGTNNQILIADSVQTDGIKWGDTLTTLGATTKANLITGDGSNTVIFSGTPIDGQILSALSTETSGLIWTDNANVTLTTKGDLLSRSAGGEVRVPVGSNSQILVADSTDVNGIKWEDVKDNTVLTTKGDIMTDNGTNSLRFGVGTNGQVLTAASGEVTGLIWTTTVSVKPKTWSFFHTTAVGVDGGTATIGSWTTRTLNLSDTCNPTGATLLANQITVATGGDYIFQVFQSFGNVNDVQIRVRNITTGTTIQGTTASLRSTTASGQVTCNALGNVSAADVLEIQYYAQQTGGGDGLGNSAQAASGEINILATLSITEAF